MRSLVDSRLLRRALCANHGPGAFENQRNLVTAAIVLWNTVYLERAIAALRRHRQIDDALLAYVAPLGWNHINLTGDYRWQGDKRVAQGQFRPLRRPLPSARPA
jgi:hypothetical protein